MNIAIVEERPSFVGGSERMSLSIATHALRRGDAVWLVHEEPGDMVLAYASAGARTCQLPAHPIAVREPRRAWRSWRVLRRLIRREQIDIVFTSQVNYASLLAALGATTRAKTAVHLGLVYDYPSPVFRAGVRRIHLGIAPSAHTAQGWRVRGWPEQSLRVIPNGVDVEVFSSAGGQAAARAQLGLSPQVPVVAYVGRLVREKGIFTLLQAFGALRRKGKPGFLLLTGNAAGDEVKTLHELAARESLSPSDWRVQPSTREPEVIYRAADLVVVPSEAEESFGLVPLEALACGTMAIVSNRSVLPSFVRPIGASAVFTSGDRESLGVCLAYWLHDADRRLHAAKVLQAYVRSEYSVERCGEAYRQAFLSLLSR